MTTQSRVEKSILDFGQVTETPIEIFSLNWLHVNCIMRLNCIFELNNKKSPYSGLFITLVFLATFMCKSSNFTIECFRKIATLTVAART